MTRPEAFSTYINFARLLVERDRRFYRENFMPDLPKVEIKGLAVGVQSAQKRIDRARAAMDRVNETGAVLEHIANGVADAFEKHADDLLFQANNLGNGSGESDKPEPPTELPDKSFQQPGAGNGA